MIPWETVGSFFSFFVFWLLLLLFCFSIFKIGKSNSLFSDFLLFLFHFSSQRSFFFSVLKLFVGQCVNIFIHRVCKYYSFLFLSHSFVRYNAKDKVTIMSYYFPDSSLQLLQSIRSIYIFFLRYGQISCIYFVVSEISSYLHSQLMVLFSNRCNERQKIVCIAYVYDQNQSSWNQDDSKSYICLWYFLS